MERDAGEEKESRVILRQVQDHLIYVHTNLGAVRETVGLVEVFHHPTNPLPNLNYVTPRRNTAWVSSQAVKEGLNHLNTFGRSARVQYIEGLFPPLFAKTLRDLKLQVERETPIMAYKVGGVSGHVPPPPAQTASPDGVSIAQVNDQRGIEMWWYVWRNAFYDVLTLGVEPLFVGRDMAALALGQQLDFLAYRHGNPVGVARLSIQNETAHISALALMKEARTLAMTHALQNAVLKTALEHKAKLVFAPGETEADRRLLRELGFLDFGSIVCYSAPGEKAHEDSHVNPLEQPVLSF
ncbi:MAG: GNAT family N-acetyltransferase [Chloroflexota bacterium]